jgi:hypothetical protein
MRYVIAVLVVCAVVLGGACKKKDEAAAGGGPAVPADLCAAKSKCPNEGPMPPEMLEMCKAMRDDAKCGAAFKTMMTCAIQKEVCNAEGKHDEAETDKLCGAESEAFEECFKSMMTIGEPPAENP